MQRRQNPWTTPFGIVFIVVAVVFCGFGIFAASEMRNRFQSRDSIRQGYQVDPSIEAGDLAPEVLEPLATPSSYSAPADYDMDVDTTSPGSPPTYVSDIDRAETDMNMTADLKGVMSASPSPSYGDDNGSAGDTKRR